MVEETSEKNLGGMMPAALVDKFTRQAEQRGSKIKRSLAAAVKLWVELPPEIQARLLDQSLSSDSFIGLVQEIVDERIQAGRKAARKLVSPRPRKRGRKG